MTTYTGKQKDITGYRPINVAGKWLIAITAYGEEWLDTDADGHIKFDSENSAKNYCSQMLELVNVLNDALHNKSKESV